MSEMSKPDAWCHECRLPVWEHGGHWLDDTDNHHDGHNVGPLPEPTSDIPHEYEVSFIVEVSPEDGDTAESLAAYVHDLADEWLTGIDYWEVKPIPLRGSR